jgi:hypothetical protein
MTPEPDPPACLTGRRRDVYFFTHPRQWGLWPFLPLIRRCPGSEDELGVLFDALGACGLAGHSATVFLSNLFCLPRTLDELLTLPKEVFDAPEELADAGWRVD